MSGSHFQIILENNVEQGTLDVALHIFYKNEGKEVIEYPLGDIPAGGLNTTVSDLARLAMMVNNHGKLNGRQVLSANTLDTMFTVQNSDIPLELENQN